MLSQLKRVLLTEAALDDFVKASLFAICNQTRAIVYAAAPADGEVAEENIDILGERNGAVVEIDSGSENGEE